VLTDCFVEDLRMTAQICDGVTFLMCKEKNVSKTNSVEVYALESTI
jgi:hypothetical protein